MRTAAVPPLAASNDLLQVSKPPQFLTASREATLSGAFFCDVIGQPGAVDHVHNLICVQDTLSPIGVRALSGATSWEEIGPGFRVWLPGDEQRRESRVPARHRFLFLRPQQFERIAHRPFSGNLRMPGRHATVPGLFVDRLLAAMSADIADGCPGGTLVGDSLVVALVNWLLNHVSGDATAERTEALPKAALDRLVEFVEERLDQSLSIEELATVVGLSPRHLCRVLKATIGASPHQWVLSRRVDRVAMLIRQGTTDLADIAIATGFSDQSSMSKVFKRVLGVTPGAYRATLD